MNIARIYNWDVKALNLAPWREVFLALGIGLVDFNAKLCTS